MSKINQEEILGAFIPDVYISQIVLETSGTPFVDSNPHIDVASEKVVGKQSNDNLLITLHLIVKEKYSSDLISNWFDNIDIQKYLKIKVFQSLDQKTTSFLSLSQDMLEILDDERSSISANDKRLKMAGSIFESDSLEFIFNRLQKTTKSQTLNTLKKAKISKFIDDNNNETTNINYTVKFVVNNAFPEHLAYFVVTGFDIMKLAQDFNLEYDTLTFDKMNGKVVSDVVIEDGDLVDRSYVFIDQNGNLWPGAVHLDRNNQWRSKSEETSDSINLTMDTISNSKIQDFRNIKDIQKLQYDFSAINNNLGDIEIRMASSDKIDPQRLDEYFSEFNIAMDRNGDTKFFFSINYEKIITNFSLFGGLIKRSGSRFIQEMMVKTKIKQMKIIRRRIKFDGSVNRFGVLNGIKQFDSNEPNEIICVASEKAFKKFIPSNNTKGALREVEIVLDSTEPGIRHFTGMDKAMSEVTDGHYQYGIEIDIDDGSLEFFKGKVIDLREAHSELLAYFNEASKLSISKFIAEVQDPHIEHPSESSLKIHKLSGNFDFESNKFTRNFANLMASRYSGSKITGAPWIAPIAIYADVLDMFTDAFKSRRDRRVVLNSLFMFASPKTGNPSGIATVLKLIDNLISSIETIVQTGESKSSKKSRSKIQKSDLHSGKSNKRSIRFQKFFNVSFNSNQIKGVGMDYLSNGHDDTKNDNGLKVISGADYLHRINTETLKFYNDIDSDLNLTISGRTLTKDKISNTSFSYLSPSRIDLPRKSIALINQASAPQIQSISKKNRISENISDGLINAKHKFSQLQTTMLVQNLTRRPIASMFDKYGKSKNNENVSFKAVEEMLTNVLSEFGSVIVQPVALEQDDDEENKFTIKPFPRKSIEIPNNLFGNPQPAETKTRKIENRDIGGVTAFMQVLTRGLTQNGASSLNPNGTSISNTLESSQIFTQESNNGLVEILNPTNLTIVDTIPETTTTIVNTRPSPNRRRIPITNPLVTPPVLPVLPNFLPIVPLRQFPLLNQLPLRTLNVQATNLSLINGTSTPGATQQPVTIQPGLITTSGDD